jgi:hypothetical protein
VIRRAEPHTRDRGQRYTGQGFKSCTGSFVFLQVLPSDPLSRRYFLPRRVHASSPIYIISVVIMSPEATVLGTIYLLLRKYDPVNGFLHPGSGS